MDPISSLTSRSSLHVPDAAPTPVAAPPAPAPAPAAAAAAVPAPATAHVGASQPLQDLCERICKGVKHPSTAAMLIRRSSLLETLRAASRSRYVTKQQWTGAALPRMLENHQGPVIVLGPNNLPLYVFERRDGQWQGYNGFFQALPPESSSPSGVLASLNTSAGLEIYTLDRWQPLVDPRAAARTDPPIVIRLNQAQLDQITRPRRA